ncbi:G2/mitotic-specific cyclin CYB1 [Rhodotorula toruloides]|uniref:G2/mitotic-specific cyclin CYB1 n=1 Tax=Rhodotorula toruloides TaxID=5286 RepID=A0A511KKK1_RHOTO|nr:G2/mitotic-specific cyclin CYB1 [Rhodotorula toruloides]
MQTRRVTRRSLTNQQVENDLANRVGGGPARAASSAGAAGPVKQGVALAVTGKAAVGTSATGGSRRTVVGTSKGVLADKTAAANAAAGAAAARGKRSAFTDVTNGKGASKSQLAVAGPSKAAAASSKTAVPAPAAAATSSNTVKRTYRTRSSTGGVKQEPADDAAGLESDAMAIDEDVKPAARQVRALRKPTAGIKASTSTTAAATSRRPLAAKRANIPAASTRRPAAAAAVKVKTTPPAVRAARQRREEAEAKHRAALAELESARRVEEAELKRAREIEELELEDGGRRAKRQKTSEPEPLEYVEEDEEDEGAVDYEQARVSKWETEVEEKPKWVDLDAGDEEDPLMVSTYVVEIYEYLRELELTTMPDPDYISNQNEVTWKMRGILVDWLVEIHTKFRLLPETIFLAVNILDRFLSVRVVSLVKFQLVGVTALFIAAKYEEVVCPSVQNFLFMTDGGFTDEELLKAERYILGIIDFNLSYPNPLNFLRRISKAEGYDIQCRTMAKYLMEISIVDHRFMAAPPSLVAAAATWLARRVLEKGEWDANLIHYSGYTEDELKPTAQLMLDYVVRTSPHLTSWAQSLAEGEEAIENPLESSPIEHEQEHPNFVKKYAAKKFFKASVAMRKWAEAEYAPESYYDDDGELQRRAVPLEL